MILQETPRVVVVGGAGWGPPVKLYYRRVWQVEVGYLGAIAIKPVEVVLEILVVAEQLQEPTLVCCRLGVNKEVIVMLVRWLMVVSSWLPFK